MFGKALVVEGPKSISYSCPDMLFAKDVMQHDKIFADERNCLFVDKEQETFGWNFPEPHMPGDTQ